MVDLAERCLPRRGALWTIAVFLNFLINHKQTVLTPRTSISNCFIVKEEMIFASYRKQCLLSLRVLLFASGEFPPPLAVLSKLQIPFQNLMPKQKGDPTVSLLELITCSSGHAAAAVRGGKLLLWKTVADGAKKTWSKLSLRFFYNTF